MEGLDWLRLIFHWCDFTSLLQLRASCVLFRTVLSLAEANNRVWRRHTSWLLPRLRHDERALGWSGVMTAMAREERTRTNCVSGRYRETVYGVDYVIQYMFIIGRRLLVTNGGLHSTANLFDLDTSTLIAQFNCGLLAYGFMYDDLTFPVILDRWTPFRILDETDGDRYGRWVLLDCVTGTLGTEVIVTSRPLGPIKFGAAGVHFSHCDSRRTIVTICHVDQPSKFVRRVELGNYHDSFELCRDGESFIMTRDRSIALYDVQTGLVMRVIDTLYNGAGIWMSSDRMFFKYDRPGCKLSFIYHVDNELPTQLSDSIYTYLLGSDVIQHDVDDMSDCISSRHHHYTNAKTNATVCIPNPNDGRVLSTDQWSGACVNYDASKGFAVFRRALTNFDETHAIHVNPVRDYNNVLGPFRHGALVIRLTSRSVRVLRFDE